MSFHLLCELPVQAPSVLDHESEVLTAEEVRILKSQIRRNSQWIDQYVARLDLFVNKEKYPHQEAFLGKMRKRLFILMEENDTFRKVLWRHCQRETLV